MMKMNSRMKTNLKSFGGALLGVSFTMGLLLLINSSFMNFGKSKDSKKVVKFNIEKQVLKKKVTRMKKKKPKKKQDQLKPDLKSMVAGLSFGIPAFEMDLGSGSDFLSQGDYVDGAKVDQKPKVVYRADLEFPEQALSDKKSGYVTFGMFIDANGDLKKVDVIESYPKGLFDKAALSSLKKWKFKPAVHKGINVATWQEQKIVFDAEES